MVLCISNKNNPQLTQKMSHIGNSPTMSHSSTGSVDRHQDIGNLLRGPKFQPCTCKL